jgi:hypothetical protein
MHEFIDDFVSLSTTLLDRVGNTVFYVPLENQHSHSIERRSDGRNLGKNIHTVLLVLDHALDSSNLSLYIGQSLQGFFIDWMGTSFFFVRGCSNHSSIEPIIVVIHRLRTPF